jgi:(1->4)-alpha-D-glucan 1-alpha-D-glucosylmutase
MTRIPSSTYRIQLSRCFTFQDAARLVPYLKDLGIGALYTSPILMARPGSSHGYDVVDHERLNPELGTASDFRSLGETLRAAGMGWIVDIVPNHMCIAGSNWRWFDVLENGPSSPQSRFFDIDWHPPRPGLQHKILLPVLGDQFGRVLENMRTEARLFRCGIHDPVRGSPVSGGAAELAHHSSTAGGNTTRPTWCNALIRS